jgi:hypothetical protein
MSGRLVSPSTMRSIVADWLGEPLIGDVTLGEVPGLRRVSRVSTATRSVIVKCDAGGNAVTAACHLAGLADGLAAGSAAMITAPLVVDAVHGIVVTADAGNRRLDLAAQQWGTGSASAVAALRLAGTALAEVHRLNPSGLPRAGLGDHVEQLIDPHPLDLAVELPEWADVIHAALQQIGRLVQGWQLSATAVVMHRDFHLRQLMIVDDRLAIVDWDLIAAGDPAFDVAFMLTYLETHHLDTDGCLAEAFLQGYLAQAPILDVEGFHLRLRGYRLFNLLRRASRRHRLRDHGWHGQRMAMLQLLADEMADEMTGRSVEAS